MKKNYLLLILFISISCSSLIDNDLPDIKNNRIIVKNIISNYKDLNNYLNNKKICDSFLLMYSFNLWMDDLYKHIIMNKFYDGYKFEIIDSIGIHRIADHNDIIYTNEIKIRSNYNQDIIWFSFTLYNSEKIWKLNSFSFCNNASQRSWGEDVPCDKK